MTALPRSFYARDTRVVARELLGCRLVRESPEGTAVGRIVEVEAYHGEDDPACHAAPGPTSRNEPLYGPPGRAYVYLIYGIHWCLNVVTALEDDPQAVLIRALEPLEGARTMARRRGRDRDLCSGPGRLCQALGVSGDLDGHPLDRPPLRLEPGWSLDGSRIGRSGRVGVTAATEWPLRFFVRDNPHVSTSESAG